SRLPRSVISRLGRSVRGRCQRAGGIRLGGGMLFLSQPADFRQQAAMAVAAFTGSAGLDSGDGPGETVDAFEDDVNDSRSEGKLSLASEVESGLHLVG